MGFKKELQFWIKQYINKLKLENKSKNTIDSYNRTYNSFLDFLDYYKEEYNKELSFLNLKEQDIYAFLQYKEDFMQKQGEIAVATKKALITHLKRLFKYIEKNADELYDFDKVFEDINFKLNPRKPKGLNKDEQERLLQYLSNQIELKTDFISYRNSLIVKLMLLAGLRVSEVLNIVLNDFVFVKNGKEYYKITIKGKGNKIRQAYINKDEIEEELEFLNSYFNGNNNYIAVTSKNKRMDRIQIFKMLNSIYKKVGIKKSGVHILRHTFAKNLVEKNISLSVIQKLLGHSNINTTSIYTNPDEDMVLNSLNY